MNILLINTDVCPIAKVYPIGLDYLTSVLHDKGYAVDTLDLAFLSRSAWNSSLHTLLRTKEYLAVGIGIRNLYDEIINGNTYVSEIITLIQYIKKEINNNKQATKVIIGGSGTSLMANTILTRSGADAAVVHEGEAAFLEILSSLKEQNRLTKRLWMQTVDISNISFRRGSWGNFHGYFKQHSSGNLQTKRGCQMQCLYCEYPAIEGTLQRFRDPEIVAEEFLQLEKLGFPRIYIVDATFNNPRDQAKNIMNGLIGHNTQKEWLAFLNPRLIDKEFLELAQASHISLPIKLTIESGSNSILRTLQKSFRREHIEQAVDLCRAMNVPFSFTLLFGGPGESKETIRETCQLIKNSSPCYVTMNIGLYIHPHTPIALKTKNILWHSEENFVEPMIYPCNREEIKSYIAEELLGSGIPYNIYEGGEN